MEKTVALILIILMVATSCGNPNQEDKTQDIRTDSSKDKQQENKTVDSGTPPSIKEKGDRLLGITITQAEKMDFSEAFKIAKQTGFEVIVLPIAWDEIETSTKKYESGFLSIANSFYPKEKIKIILVLNPIDTNVLRTPKDLKDKRIDDPEVIARFKAVIDYAFSQLKDSELVAVSIGNEIDRYLGKDEEKWSQYKNFYKAASAYVKSKKPEVKVGTKGTFDGMTGSSKQNLIEINKNSDVIMVTYYPIAEDFSVRSPSVVDSDFGTLTQMYDKAVYLMEIGYPSSSELGSSEQKQAEFVRESFKAWDKRSSQVKFLNFEWLHEKSKSDLDYFEKYYGFSSKDFRAYLGSLGLRTSSGKDKPAFVALKEEQAKRS